MSCLVLAAMLLPQSAEAVPFDAPLEVLDGSFSGNSVVRRLIELEGDTLPDLVAVYQTTGSTSLELHRNLGAGTFERVYTSPFVTTAMIGGQPVPKYFNFVEVGDLDADGDQDVVLLRGKHLLRFAVQGLTASHSQEVLTGVQRLAMASGDLDGDGRTDVVTALPTELELRFSGGAVVVLPHQAYLWGEPLLTHDLRAADLDGDGDLDLALATATRVQWIELEDGQWVANHPAVEHGLGMVMFDTGDVDGDLDQDGVLFAMGGQLRVWRNGPQGPVLEPAAVGGPAEFLRDVDGDGDLDGACCSSGGGGGGPEGLTYTVPSFFEIALNDGHGSFAPSFRLLGQGALQLAGVADLDGDGDPDLVAGRAAYLSRGPLSQSSFASGAEWPALASAAAHDVDGDGDLDFGAGLGAGTWNQGAGQFLSLESSVQAAPAGTAWVGPGFRGDWDGDGDLDLLVEQRDDLGALLGMRLLVNTGGGHLLDGGATGPVGTTFAVDSLAVERGRAVDLDLDGKLDLLTTATPPALSTRIYRNLGAGQFVLQQSLPQIAVQAAGQLDGVGAQELVGLSAVSDPNVPLVVLRMVGGGLYQASTLPSLGVTMEIEALTVRDDFCAIADFDLDGRPDIVAAFPRYSRGLPVLRNVSNLGSLAFAGHLFEATPLQTAFEASPHTARVALLDVDGDGRQDVVDGPETYGPHVSGVFLNRSKIGDLDFEVRYQILLPGPVLDLEGDGDSDLLSTMPVLNCTASPLTSGSVTQLGGPQSGAGGVWSTLTTVGDLSPGGQAVLRAVGLPGGAPGLLVFGLSGAELANFPAPGLTSYVDLFAPPVALLPLVTSGNSAVPGSGRYELPYQVQPGWAGLEFTKQVFAVDLAAPGTLAATNGLHLTYGQ
jgi:hypothetical protein